jgi:hypothetical protein
MLEQRMPIPDAIPHRRYFSLHARMIETHERLLDAAQPLPFDALAEDALDVLDLLVSFLAMLKLWRLGHIVVSMDEAGVVWLQAAASEG